MAVAFGFSAPSHARHAYIAVVPARHGRPMVTAAVYRRRRFVVGVGALLLLVLPIALTSGAFAARAQAQSLPAQATQGASAGSSAGSESAVRFYVVQPGDTMWSIAVQCAGPGGRSQFLDSLLAANGSTRIDVGQQLVLP